MNTTINFDENGVLTLRIHENESTESPLAYNIRAEYSQDEKKIILMNLINGEQQEVNPKVFDEIIATMRKDNFEDATEMIVDLVDVPVQ